MTFSVHERGLCDSTDVGSGTRIEAFAHVSSGARIGVGCTVAEQVVLRDDVVLGDRVSVQCGARLCDGVSLADDVVVGPNVTFTGGPQGGMRALNASRTMVGPGVSVGAGAVILSGVSIGRRARIGAGAVVAQDVPPNAVVEGNPARIVGYVDAERTDAAPLAVVSDDLPVSRVSGVSVLRMTRADDLRGSLVAANFEQELPFVPRRFFTVFGVPSTDVRGAHAHRQCHQLLVCLQGSIHAVVDNGSQRQEFVLNRPDIGLHMAPMIWGTQYRYSADAVLMVLASDPYDAEDYIRDHDTFLAEAALREAVSA